MLCNITFEKNKSMILNLKRCGYPLRAILIGTLSYKPLVNFVHQLDGSSSLIDT